MYYLLQDDFCLALALGAAYVDDELLEMLGLKLLQGMGRVVRRGKRASMILSRM